MLRSMTAFAKVASPSWEVEIQSLNRKALDISLFLPREYTSFEQALREELQKLLSRGQITVRIARRGQVIGAERLSHLRTLKKEWEALAKQLGYPPQEAISFQFLLSEGKSLVLPLDEKRLAKELGELKETLKKALKALLLMKEREGKNLKRDLEERLKGIEERLKEIQSLAKETVKRLQERLQEKLSAFPSSISEEAIAKEAILFADRTDIAEEIVRLSSHLEQFREKLKLKESVGRVLDFLAQEMHREMTTIAAKAQDAKIQQLSAEMRGECERIREQAQNIE